MESRENKTARSASENSFSSSLSQSQMESPLSPLQSDAPLRSDEPEPPEYSPVSSPDKHQSRALVIVEKYSPRSPRRSSPQGLPEQPNPETLPRENAKSPHSSPVVMFNRSVRDEMPAVVAKVDPSGGQDGFTGGAGGATVENGGGDRRPPGPVRPIIRRSRKMMVMKNAELAFRGCEVLFCLISFSVMAADKTQGWSGDSFDRYKEYRPHMTFKIVVMIIFIVNGGGCSYLAFYLVENSCKVIQLILFCSTSVIYWNITCISWYCLSMTVIAFVYSGFQACDLAYHLVTQNHLFSKQSHYDVNFFMDQVLAYLLMSASSSAATRVDDWQSDWGKDEFTEMASASIGMSFLAFVAFASSSIISGYNLCCRYRT